MNVSSSFYVHNEPQFIGVLNKSFVT